MQPFSYQPHPDGSFTIDGVRFVYRDIWPTGRERVPATREDRIKLCAQNKERAERQAARLAERNAEIDRQIAIAAARPPRAALVPLWSDEVV